MITTPSAYYRTQCQSGLIVEDMNQLEVIKQLDHLQANLLAERRARKGWLAFCRKPHVVQGLYIWGGVGIGKTFLMDCFYHTLPFQEKMRMHFFEFMRFVHRELKSHQGKKNPLDLIAKDISKKTMIICFDEFFVSDITDAMILARLFRALFACGVSLVATSNVKPDDLYKNGLQRPQFLPAIALIKQKTQVMHVAINVDYRLRHLKYAGVFYTPNDAIANQHLEKSFLALTEGMDASSQPIELCHRLVPIKKQAGDVVWFDFNILCAPPRSQMDYLAIAEKFSTVFISDIPIIHGHARDTIILFIRLIDVLYDAHIRLVCSAAKAADLLYQPGELSFEYERTRSRLLEMQSETYFLEGKKR